MNSAGELRAPPVALLLAPLQQHRAIARAALLTALAALLTLLVCVLLTPDAPALVPVLDLGELAAAAAAAAACGWRAHHGREVFSRRLAWALMALGCASWAAGQAVWSWYEVVADVPAPFPSLADLGFLGFPLPAAAALLLLGRGRVRLGGVARAAIDGVLVAASLFVSSWLIVLRPIVRAQGDGQLAFAISVAYPVGDLVVLAVCVLLIARTGATPALCVLALGSSAMALADSAFVYLSAQQSFSTGGVVDVGWTLAFTAITASALVSDRPRLGGQHDETPSLPALLLPYIPVSAGLVCVGTAHWRGSNDPVALASAALLIALLAARQTLILLENRSLLVQLRSQQDQLQQLAFTDSLTGAANRIAFNAAIAQAVVEGASTGRPVLVAFLDLDDFKQVNDRHGHATGDQLLVSIVKRLEAVVRAQDLVARLGGDEFAVLVTDGGLLPHELEARVRSVMDQPFGLAGETVEAGLSVGVSSVAARLPVGELVEQLLREADERMYAAKHGRRFDPGVAASAWAETGRH